ncbi:hypothetical protein EPA93_44155 [Ktedonosporobacter rubrisoli]|uniref:Helix-turn-helix protein n=1 Tax=Ktedonosporobacter rubrisoli TaxID=2509675 RepID=A0A4V0Z0B0_KTERU|nr:GntR family transcriptional regulator YhfZ [Ktedonosporobacter rubrisoli]QBD82591.1 hypothetical protein EPA93_44155 [Ktedonosporobacter rubrisoli]
MATINTEDFLSQTGRITVALARLLLHYSRGDKLPRMVDVARKLKAGNGTLQEAFNYLTRTGAIRVESHGAQGSFLAEIDYPLLWHYAGNEWVVGSMPLPYTLRYEGLATALHAQMELSELPFNMTYQRGSVSRGEMVRKGHYHYAVMSLLAAEALIKQHPELAIVTRLPASTYVSEHVLVSRLPIAEIRSIGVDTTSLDETLLTEEECRFHPEWEIVPINSTLVLDLLQEGDLDAIIWNRDGVQTALQSVHILPLQGAAYKREIAAQTAIIALKDAPVRNLLLSIFSPERITAIQHEVLERQRLPRY